MSFQPFAQKIQTLTGKTPEEFATLVQEKGLFVAGTKPGIVVDWLKSEFKLSQGNSVALYGLFKHMGYIIEVPKTPKLKTSKPYISKSKDPKPFLLREKPKFDFKARPAQPKHRSRTR